MSLEPIEPEAAPQLFLKNEEAELAEASIKGHDYRLRHFVRWCHEQGIENLNTLTGRQLHEYRLWRREDYFYCSRECRTVVLIFVISNR